MPLVSLAIVTAALAAIYLLAKLVSEWSSPLSKIPNAHFTAPFSRLWLVYLRLVGREMSTCRTLHEKLGPVIRIGPNEVSINCIEDGVQTVYGRNWDKAELYSIFQNYGIPPLFAVTKGKPHAERKRIYSQMFSKSTVDNSIEMKQNLEEVTAKINRRLDEFVKTGKIVNIFPFSEAYSMDIISRYIWGSAHGTNWVDDDKKAAHYLSAFQVVFEPWPFFVASELSHLTGILSWIGVSLLPPRIYTSLHTISSFAKEFTERSLGIGVKAMDEEKNPGPNALSPYLQHTRKKLAESKFPPEDQQNILTSDILDQIHAAHEGAGITLTYVVLELCQNTGVQGKLRSELRSLVGSGQSPLQSQLLDDVLLETLRVYPAAFGPLLRKAPEGGRVGGFDLPAGTIVGASAYALGRNEQIFKQSDAWLPKRWSEVSAEERKQMKRWVWTFGSGSRTCIGEHVALLAMKSFIADIYTNHTTIIAKESNMKQLETFMAIPADSSLFVRFEKCP